MDLVLNDEQRLLKESAEKLVARIGGPDAHRALRDSEHGFDRARQKAVADAGWISMMVPERDNGLGLGLYDLALVLEQAGRGLMTEPIGAAAICAITISVKARSKEFPAITASRILLRSASALITSR